MNVEWSLVISFDFMLYFALFKSTRSVSLLDMLGF